MPTIITGYTIESVVSPQWADAEQTAVNVIVKFEGAQNPIPFTATPDDVYSHTREIWANAMDGVYGPINPYVEPPPPPPPPPTETELLKVQVKALEARLAKLEGKA